MLVNGVTNVILEPSFVSKGVVALWVTARLRRGDGTKPSIIKGRDVEIDWFWPIGRNWLTGIWLITNCCF